MKLSFEVDSEAIEKVKETTQFVKLDDEKQEKLIKVLESFDSDKIYMNRELFIKELKKKAKDVDLAMSSVLIKTIWASIGERNEDADVCEDAKGNIESDSSLRDSESIPLKDDIYEYFNKEVKPYVSDAYIDESTLGNVGYEIPFTRHFISMKV